MSSKQNVSAKKAATKLTFGVAKPANSNGVVRKGRAKSQGVADVERGGEKTLARPVAKAGEQANTNTQLLPCGSKHWPKGADKVQIGPRYLAEGEPAAAVVLTPEIVKAVLAEMLWQEDGCAVSEGDLELHVRGGGYGLVAQQIARKAIASGVPWRDWIGAILELFNKPKDDNIVVGTTIALLDGIIKAMMAGSFDLESDADLETMLKEIGDRVNPFAESDTNVYAMHCIADAVAFIVHAEPGTAPAWSDPIVDSAERMANQIARIIGKDHGAEAAEGFVNVLRKLVPEATYAA